MWGAGVCWLPVVFGQTCFSCLVCCYEQQAHEISPPTSLGSNATAYFKEGEGKGATEKINLSISPVKNRKSFML